MINEFLSPLTNKREDEYGGSLKRIQFLMEIVAGVRKVLPERMPLFVRLSCTDWVEGGWTVEDSVALAKRLKVAGVDLIDCSSGAVVSQAKMTIGPGYQVPFAEAVRKGAGILTAAVGLITEAKQAQAIVAEGKADLVLLGKQACGILISRCMRRRRWGLRRGRGFRCSMGGREGKAKGKR